MEWNEKIIARAAEAGARYAFTSMHIPEENGLAYGSEAREMLSLLSSLDIDLIVDVGPETPAKLGCSSIYDLRGMGITCLRLDYGFSDAEIAELSSSFRIVLNASIVQGRQLEAWVSMGVDASRFIACHNFYPKPFTGLDLADVARTDEQLKSVGLNAMGFVPGDGELRGPLYEGLPTVEQHRERRSDVAFNMLELAYGGGCDVVLVGDIDLSESGWEQFSAVSAGYVDLHCALHQGYEYLANQVFYDRLDSSALVFRSSEMRTTSDRDVKVSPDAYAGAPRPVGSISLSNDRYGRYEGELEIARRDLPSDVRQNVVGQVCKADLELLPFIRSGFGARLLSVAS